MTNGKRKASDAAMTDIPTAARAASSSRLEPIEIDSSSESDAAKLDATNGGKPAADTAASTDEEGGVADADKPLPSTEDTESEEAGESRPTSSSGTRGEYMAKRGGRQT